eukprot:TRINITY_DN7462_c0_g1_i9.p1 TRINITY_DN7462_c0_g1~~TRINITY_DN7462_c0_g1_i9.p1  ORF type:complete len:166 (-),score=32.07 TRINITY_DN7462_c0_g1_i9:341-838(-)
MSLSDIIVLNVGGTRFETTRATLVSQPDSMLAKMFDPDSPLVPAKPKDDAYFLDRDPETFKVILSFLRSGQISKSCHNISDLLLHEAQFFQLPGLEAKIQEIQAKNVSGQDILNKLSQIVTKIDALEENRVSVMEKRKLMTEFREWMQEDLRNSEYFIRCGGKKY